MSLRHVCLLSIITVAVLSQVSPRIHAQSSPPGQHDFSLLSRTRSTRKPAAASKSVKAVPQSTTSPTRDPQAVTLANQALSALTGGLAITDATVQGSSNFTAGSDHESGNATLEARTGYQSHTVLALSGGQRTEVRNGSGAPPQAKSSGQDAVWHPTPLHNCWVDPAWFFPALTIQSALNDSQMAFAYIGQDTKLGTAVQHIQIYRLVPGQSALASGLIQRLSRMDIYLDATTNLPVAIDFNTHPATTATVDIPVEIQFSGWHAVNGLQSPTRIQKFLQGGLLLDLNSITVSVNTGIPQTDFTM